MELIPQEVREQTADDLRVKLNNIEMHRRLEEFGPIRLAIAESLTKGFQPISVAYYSIAHHLGRLRGEQSVLHKNM